MAIKGNSSSTAVVADVKQYTGLVLAQVKAICPTMEELNKLGLKTEKEPVYVSVDEAGINKVRIDFYVKVDQIDRLQKIAFFLEEGAMIGKTSGKHQMIDITGKTTYIDPANPDYKDWFKSETARPCLKGEEDLTNFLIAWLNIKPGDEARLNNPSALVKGNFTELKDVFKAFVNNKVRVMLIVKHMDDGKNYQNIYNRYFDRATNTSFTYWTKHINDQANSGYPLKDSYSLEFKECKAVLPSSDVDTSAPDKLKF